MSPCWICGSGGIREFLPARLTREARAEDLKSSDSRYGTTARIVECLACGFRFADPLPAPDLLALYGASQDPEYSEEEKGRVLTFRRIVKECRGFRPAARTLLDVGAGTGLLCRVAGDAGLEAWGVEPSGWGVRQARAKGGVRILQGSLPHPELSGKKFDIVTLIDVLEHLPNPLELLEAVGAALSPGGLVVIVTPNTRSLSARLLGRRWWHYRVAHVGYFDPETLSKALARSGLVPLAWRPHARSFTVGYLAKRMERYLPAGWLRRVLARQAILGGFFGRRMVLDLHDSMACYAHQPWPEETRR